MIKHLFKQAQKLLEEANHLQKQKQQTQQQISQHIPNIRISKLCQRINNPVKVYPKSRSPNVQPIPSTSSHLQQSNRQMSNIQYPNLQYGIQSLRIRCFQCDSPYHIKWDCRRCQCRYCKEVAPGHSQKGCPKNQPEIIWWWWKGIFWFRRFQR